MCVERKRDSVCVCSEGKRDRVCGEIDCEDRLRVCEREIASEREREIASVCSERNRECV